VHRRPHGADVPGVAAGHNGGEQTGHHRGPAEVV
jgi:hypothetical protein